jgi:hypothetical protein
MPEDYVCLIMASGDAHHICGMGEGPGLDFLPQSDVDSNLLIPALTTKSKRLDNCSHPRNA